MRKYLVLAAITLVALVGVGLGHTGGLSRVMAAVPLATAALPPSLEPAVLNGRPIHVLYVTRSQDTVLVRCYPGFSPPVAGAPDGGQPGSDGGGADLHQSRGSVDRTLSTGGIEKCQDSMSYC